ncbi:hypothetical protein KUTeg_023116 [Tegillarca granosa]|uniref:Uncharacterized protein n=1 Tax=Tegillarca granosa TaxID=220873 RepID=A0ABQ9E3S7_TEGGR|nr:hypothetical protein KUTeg_023116 [Tegillarca granosa]
MGDKFFSLLLLFQDFNNIFGQSCILKLDILVLSYKEHDKELQLIIRSANSIDLDDLNYVMETADFDDVKLLLYIPVEVLAVQ